MAATARKLAKCHCQSFEFGWWTAEVPEGADPGDYYETTDTGCVESTHRTFAMGHDAKLAGYLVRAELAGHEIRMVGGGVVHTFPGAVAAASTISEAFAAKVAAQLAAGVARAVRREAAAARKAAKKTAPAPAAPTTREATIKIGRWFYNATIDLATGDATYAMKSGEVRTAKAGDFQEQ